MKTKDLIFLGVPAGEPIQHAHEFIQRYIADGNEGARLGEEIFQIVADPSAYFADPLRAPLALPMSPGAAVSHIVRSVAVSVGSGARCDAAAPASMEGVKAPPGCRTRRSTMTAPQASDGDPPAPLPRP